MSTDKGMRGSGRYTKSITPQEREEDSHDHEFLRVLAHQIKSPINTIESMLHSLSEGLAGDLPPRAKYFIEKAIHKADEARNLVADILFFEMVVDRPEESRIELDFSSVMANLVSSYHAQASDKNVTLSFYAPTGLKIMMEGNQTGLEHAFRNLIDNAIKYTPEGGEVTISLSFDEETHLATLAITDTGAGIPEDELDSIFEPFYRSRQHRGQVSGTGLGLPITRRVILNHGGTIVVESEVGHGTTFTITLPIVRVDEQTEDSVPRTRVVIIGGVTAGPKLAARLRRLNQDISITIIEKSEFLSYSGCGLPYYVSGKVSTPKALMSTTDNTLRDVHYFHAIKDVTIRNKTLATSINRLNKSVAVQDLSTYRTDKIPYDILVLATGAVPHVPDIPGIEEQGIYSFYRIEDAEALKKRLQHARAHDVYIIGGGLIGAETSESLADAGARVTILEKEPCLLSNLLDHSICHKIQKDLGAKGIKTVTGCAVERILKRGDKLSIVTEQDVFQADFILLSAGVKPNTELARQAGLEISPSGGIRVDEYLRTSDPTIFAVGDCASTPHRLTDRPSYWPLGSVSTRMGRVAADVIAGRDVAFPGTIGTCMFKVYENTVARTGLTCAAAKEAGFDPESIVVSGLDRAHYIPGAHPILLKVIADRSSRVLLGAQGYGKGDVDKRIELLAAAIFQKMTLEEFIDLDLGYFPAFNNPIDLVQHACCSLANKLDGLVRTLGLSDLEARGDSIRLVDVSPLTEFAFETIPGAINVPLENLRAEGLPFGNDDPILLFSRTSSRAYEAYRYLVSRGFNDLYILEGGYLFWK